METITKLNRWANAHTNPLTDVLRLMFGAFIFYKGILYLTQTEVLYSIFKTVGGEGAYFFMVHYVALSHLCGGLFIMMGLITRLSALMQLPILLGAIVFNILGSLSNLSLAEAVITFIICIFFVLYGSGKHSVDYNLRLHV